MLSSGNKSLSQSQIQQENRSVAAFHLPLLHPGICSFIGGALYNNTRLSHFDINEFVVHLFPLLSETT